MIGIGKWQGTVNIQILKFSGDVFITISDNNGEYNVDIQLPKQLEKVKLRFETIEETGDKEMISRELIVTKNFGDETLSQIKLPKGVLVLMINRDDKIIVPRGNSTLQEGDLLTVLGSPDAIKECRHIFSE